MIVVNNLLITFVQSGRSHFLRIVVLNEYYCRVTVNPPIPANIVDHLFNDEILVE